MRLQVYTLSILILAIAIAQIPLIIHAQDTQENQWALGFYSANVQSVASKTFFPFDLIQLVANVTYGNASQPGILVAFKVHGPTDSADQTNITRIVSTDNDGQAEFEFRLPIEAENNDTVVGTWQATAIIQTTNGTLQQTLSFSTQWSMQIASITLENAQDKNQTTFSAGSVVMVQLAVNNYDQAQATNVTVSMQDSSGKVTNQTQISNIQIGTSNPTQVKANIQIPSNETASQASISVALFSGSFEGTSIPVSQSKTASFTITAPSSPTPTPTTIPTPTPTPTPTPSPKLKPVETSISLFSWLLVATALFTFTSLTVLLRRKPYPPSGQGPKPPTVPVTSAPAPADTTQLSIPSGSAMELSAQQAGLQPLATQLSTVSGTAQRIEALQTALRMERQQLAKDIVDLTKTVDEQEKAIMKYFEMVRQEMKRLGTIISDQNVSQTEAKVQQNAPPSEEKIKQDLTVPPPEVKDKQTSIGEQSPPGKNTKETTRDYNTTRQERTLKEDIRTAEHTRED